MEGKYKDKNVKIYLVLFFAAVINTAIYNVCYTYTVCIYLCLWS